MLYALVDLGVDVFLMVGKAVVKGVTWMFFGRQETDMERIERILSEMQVELVEIKETMEKGPDAVSLS